MQAGVAGKVAISSLRAPEARSVLLMLSTASRRNFLLAARSRGNACVISFTLVLMMIFPHSIIANAPGLHRNSKNGSTMIGEPANRARSMFACNRRPSGERRDRCTGRSQKT
jgi:hypothetical protein